MSRALLLLDHDGYDQEQADVGEDEDTLDEEDEDLDVEIPVPSPLVIAGRTPRRLMYGKGDLSRPRLHWFLVCCLLGCASAFRCARFFVNFMYQDLFFLSIQFFFSS